MTPGDVDTVLAVVLAEDFPKPDPIYVEVPWLLDDGREVRSVVISGRVAGDTVTAFAAEDESGRPIRFPDSDMPEALQDLIETARELWRTP